MVVVTVTSTETRYVRGGRERKTRSVVACAHTHTRVRGILVLYSLIKVQLVSISYLGPDRPLFT